MLTQVAKDINARFWKSPFSSALWPSSGALADAGVLLHCFDGYEDNAHPWKARDGISDISASLIFGLFAPPMRLSSQPVFSSAAV